MRVVSMRPTDNGREIRDIREEMTHLSSLCIWTQQRPTDDNKKTFPYSSVTPRMPSVLWHWVLVRWWHWFDCCLEPSISWSSSCQQCHLHHLFLQQNPYWFHILTLSNPDCSSNWPLQRVLFCQLHSTKLCTRFDYTKTLEFEEVNLMTIWWCIPQKNDECTSIYCMCNISVTAASEILSYICNCKWQIHSKCHDMHIPVATTTVSWQSLCRIIWVSHYQTWSNTLTHTISNAFYPQHPSWARTINNWKN